MRPKQTRFGKTSSLDLSAKIDGTKMFTKSKFFEVFDEYLVFSQLACLRKVLIQYYNSNLPIVCFF
jgi:hypothetical protein